MPASRPFFTFWRTRATFISELHPVENVHEANVLTWAAFDALAGLWARSARPELHGVSDRRRMGDFLGRHAGDPFQRVSLPAIWARTDGLGTKVPTDVRERLRTVGGRRAPTVLEDRQARTIAEDPLVGDLLTSFVDVADVVVAKPVTVRDVILGARFGEIAYAEMRCAILHEGRLGTGAHGFDFGAESDAGPTYLSAMFSAPPTIGFSPRYMRDVLAACIDSFEEEVSASGINPVPAPPRCIVLDPSDDAP